MPGVVTLEQLSVDTALCRSQGRRVGLVLGVFDLLHPGHIALIERASNGCDFLVAAVFDDASSRVLKGPGRPFTRCADRAEVVAALRSVDAVVHVDGLESAAVVQSIGPDVIFTGDDGHLGASVPVTVLRQTGDFSATRIARELIEGVDFLPESRQAVVPTLPGKPAEVSFTYVSPGSTRADHSRVFTLRGAGNDDLILSIIREYGTFFELEALLLLQRITGNGGVAIDAGANIGNHSIFFGAFLAEQVVAIEPVPEMFELLRHNLEVNGAMNVIPVRAAVGRAPGVGHVFRPPSSAHNAGAVQIRMPGMAAKGSDEPVSIVTIDDVVAGLRDELGDRRVTLLKIDVEGNEYAALLGAQKTVETFRPVIAVELVAAYTFNAVNALLSGYGYRPVARFGDVIPQYVFRSEINAAAKP